MTWTRTVRAASVDAVWTGAGSIRWIYAAVLSRWKGPGVATPSARRTAAVSCSPSCRSVPTGKRSARAHTSIMGMRGLLCNDMVYSRSLCMPAYIASWQYYNYDDHHSQEGTSWYGTFAHA